jgi:hypothetical protein
VDVRDRDEIGAVDVRNRDETGAVDVRNRDEIGAVARLGETELETGALVRVPVTL